MAQPQWITPAGNLGTIPEGVFYQQSLLASTDAIVTVTVTASSSTTNRFTCASTLGIYPGLNVMFSAPNNAVFGGVNTITRYFVLQVFNATEFSIAVSEYETDPIPLTTATGSMTATFTQHVFYRLIAGELPPGVQVSDNGLIIGIPQAVASLQGVPLPVSQDVTYRFAVRGYTKKPALPTQVDRIADRTFSLTITGQDIPDFLTPPGNIGTYYDGSEASIQILFTDTDPGDQVRIKVLSGELPPGLVLDPITGLISGIIKPLVGPAGTATAGYDATQYSEYPFDFSTRSASKNYQFTLELSDGKDANLRTFEIYVYSRDSLSADTTDFTADNTFITADASPIRTPILITPEGDLGRIRANNFYAFKFDAIDFDGDAIEYSITTGAGVGFDETLFDQNNIGFDRGAFSLPPGLTINAITGWFYGYIPDQGATEQTYRFAIRVYKAADPTVISGFYYFTITIIGDIDTEIRWITPPDLGYINNGAISTLSVIATNVENRVLQYRLEQGSNSRLPEGLTLQSSGNITGRVSFNTFALDDGTTVFDAEGVTYRDINETTFDQDYSFTVNAYSAETEQVGYQVSTIVITNGGSGFTGQPTVTISAPPATAGAIQATAGIATISSGVITAIAVGNPGRGYTSPPTITITGGGGSNATAVAQITEVEITNAISVYRRFTIHVVRTYQEPYQTLYVKCMPPEEDRALINQLVLNQDIIPAELVYRADDPNFGVAKSVIYNHAYGLAAADLETYVQSLYLNHYWKNVTLGSIKTAQALDPNGNVLYEVVYSEVIDNLVNNQGESVSKEITWPEPIEMPDSSLLSTLYPNSLINMRDQVIDTVGQVAPALPLWMTSKQTNGRVLGFTPAWVIAYVKPGKSGQVAYNISENFDSNLNVIDFKIDRYEIDRSQTYQWDNATNKWEPYPPTVTTFDTYSTPASLVGWTNVSSVTVLWENNENEVVFWETPPSGLPLTGTIFDGGSLTFITPTVRWVATDSFDKYLVFPKINILE